MTASTRAPYAGIDISKDTLHVAAATDLRTLATKAFVLPYDQQGLDALTRWLEDSGIERVVFEASGGYERPLMRHLEDIEHPFALLQPARVRKLAEGLGILEKTDPLDAQMLARVATLDCYHLYTPRTEAQVELIALMDRRRQLVKARTTLKNQHHKTSHAWIQQQQQEQLELLTRQLEALEQRLEELVEGDEALAARFALLMQAPGVGQVVSWTLLAYVPELGELGGKAISRLCGVAPLAQESGQWEGRRSVRPSRQPVRAALWMASLGAIRKDDEGLGAFYERLRDRGKPVAVARVAVMRKLLRALNAMLLQGEGWQAEKVRPGAGRSAPAA